ncbi:MAG: restriction endonuclease subunit S, partial [Gaiellaceae bacterium]
GNAHPRLTSNDVHNMFIPIPDTEVQDAIADLEAENRSTARAKREQVEDDWHAAKARFGDALIATG